MEFKIKHRGQKLRVRQMASGEIITRYCLCASIGYSADTPIKDLHYEETQMIGDKVSDHPGRIYVEVLSPVWRNATSLENVSARMSFDAVKRQTVLF
jgi:hypothetical protein